MPEYTTQDRASGANENGQGIRRRLSSSCYLPEPDAIFLTMATTSLRSVSFRLVE